MENWDEMALVGRVARPHGIRGQVIVNPETDFPQERFQVGSTLFVNRGGAVERFTVTSVRFQQGRPVMGLTGVDDMNTALTLAGTELRVPVDWLAPLPDGVFYRHDLIGCQVVTRDGTAIGVVRDVEGTTGGSRLVLETVNGEVLIPLAVDICVAIEPAARQIVVDLPAGLLELNVPAPRTERQAKRKA